METIAKIRRAHFSDKKPLRQIAREMNLSRNTVRKIIRSEATELHYERKIQTRPKLEPFKEQLIQSLEEDQKKPPKYRRTALLLFEMLQREGFSGGYDTVRRFVKRWREQDTGTKAFIPLVFAPGEAFQFDWSYEQIELDGVNVKIKLAHFRLSHSRAPFCVAYMRETLEMVLDAHVQAFQFYGGSCRKGIYDNLKTVVSKVLVGKERIFNRRFQTLASHYLFEPVACTPAAGWEKGQVERQVGVIRQCLFGKRRMFADLDELNQWLQDECRVLAARQKHPDYPEQTVAEVAQMERESLVPVPVAFDAYQENTARVTPTSLVSFDRNRYSVQASSAGKIVTVRAYANRISFHHGGKLIGLHRRQYGRDRTTYTPWHYLDVLKRKPGALRNGAPFQNWELPQALQKTKEQLSRRSDGDRQFVGILAVIPRYGIGAVEQACKEALLSRTISRDLVLNILSRANEPQTTTDFQAPDHLPQLSLFPTVDCQRYNRLLSGGRNAS